MKFSIFDNDGTLGQEETRTVVLRGTVTVSQLFSPNLFNVDSWMETGLRNRGFTVNKVRMSAAGWIGYTNNVEIETELYNSFTAEQQRRAIQSAIGEITANYGVNRVFYNVTLSVAYDANAAQSGGSAASTPKPRTSTSSNAPSPSPPSTYDQSAGSPRGSNFVDNLGLGLGVSTPIVVGAAALLVVLALKR